MNEHYDDFIDETRQDPVPLCQSEDIAEYLNYCDLLGVWPV